MSKLGMTLKEKYGFENPFKTDPLLRRGIKYCNGTTALDMGCGEGADSVFLARRGYKVTAFDKNEIYIGRFQKYCSDDHLDINIHLSDAMRFPFPRNKYDVIISMLVICCMKRSEFEFILPALKRSLKPGGVLIVSSRNELDPEFQEYASSNRPVEPNTFPSKENCCSFVYFIEKNRLREAFQDFNVLYYFEGKVSCKYGEHPSHNDSYTICQRKK